MMSRLTILLCIFIGLSHNTHADALVDQKMLLAILDKEVSRLQTIAANPILVNAVIEQNNEHLNLPEIQQRDAIWRGSDTQASLKSSMLSNPSSQYLKQLIIHQGRLYSEAFTTDNQGANVGTYPLTSDYWQGDESKWSSSYNMGSGIVFINGIELDESTNTQAAQISVPIKSDGATIGVMVIGVRLSHVLSKQLSELSR